MIYWLVFRTLLSGIIILYAQILFMPKLSIAGIYPNLFLGWMVFEVWRKPVNLVLPIIFILGICYDLTMPTMLGMHTLIFVLLTVGIDEFRRPLEKDSYITMAITVGLVALIYSLLILLIYGIQSGFTLVLFLSFLGMFFYNLICTTLLVALFLFLSHLRLDFRHG